jgi:hypothetical protein
VRGLAAKLRAGATPKLGLTDPARSFYRYYAGFSEKFVEELLPLLAPDRDALVFDPWNGAGTTTTVSARCGFRSVGVDRNPVLVAIATARGLPSKRALSHLRRIRKCLRLPPKETEPLPADPLAHWFGPKFVREFRGFQKLVLGEGGTDRAEPIAIEAFPGVHAIAHVLFFRVARRLAAPVFGSNPTWISRRALVRRISVTTDQLRAVLDEELRLLHIYYSEVGDVSPLSPKIVLGDSTRITPELVGGQVGMIVTSPPYGTRIDYAMAMAIELACLEPFASFDFGSLRRQLIGTTLTSHTASTVNSLWGAEAGAFLHRVKTHRSKASGAYYSRYYENYFAGLFESLASIDAICRRGVPAAFVVQGSYYKEIYLDLARVISQMLEGLGWRLAARADREVMVSFTLLNPASKNYPKMHRPVESVVILRKK